MKSSFEIGDRVRFNRQFLQSICAYTGTTPQARGTITGFWGRQPDGPHQVGSPLLQRQPLRRCSHSQPPEGQTMKRFVAVFKVRLPNGDESRDFHNHFR